MADDRYESFILDGNGYVFNGHFGTLRAYGDFDENYNDLISVFFLLPLDLKEQEILKVSENNSFKSTYRSDEFIDVYREVVDIQKKRLLERDTISKTNPVIIEMSKHNAEKSNLSKIPEFQKTVYTIYEKLSVKNANTTKAYYETINLINDPTLLDFLNVIDLPKTISELQLKNIIELVEYNFFVNNLTSNFENSILTKLEKNLDDDKIKEIRFTSITQGMWI